MIDSGTEENLIELDPREDDNENSARIFAQKHEAQFVGVGHSNSAMEDARTKVSSHRPPRRTHNAPS